MNLIRKFSFILNPTLSWVNYAVDNEESYQKIFFEGKISSSDPYIKIKWEGGEKNEIVEDWIWQHNFLFIIGISKDEIKNSYMRIGVEDFYGDTLYPTKRFVFRFGLSDQKDLNNISSKIANSKTQLIFDCEISIDQFIKKKSSYIWDTIKENISLTANVKAFEFRQIFSHK